MQDISNKWKRQKYTNPLGPKPPSGENKYGHSLEHVVMATILQTASAGPEKAHFVVNSSRMRDSNETTNSILSDLTQAESLRAKFTANRPLNDRSRSDRAKSLKESSAKYRATLKPKNIQDPGRPDPSIMSQYRVNQRKKRSENKVPVINSFDPLWLEEPSPCPFGLIESFDSLEWGNGSTFCGGVTFMTVSDPWTSLLNQTFHMGRRRAAVDNDGFPKIIST
jgi:hypothetical protein